MTDKIKKELSLADGPLDWLEASWGLSAAECADGFCPYAEYLPTGYEYVDGDGDDYGAGDLVTGAAAVKAVKSK